jgi:hypothetical protein
VTITTSAASDEEAFALLLAFGMPFAREGRPGGSTPSPEEQAEREEAARHEEARAKAEAEQAALEQLKEENPEAYERTDEADSAAEAETESPDEDS